MIVHTLFCFLTLVHRELTLSLSYPLVCNLVNCYWNITDTQLFVFRGSGGSGADIFASHRECGCG